MRTKTPLLLVLFCAILLVSVVLSGLYPVLISLYGTLYLPETLAGYLGFLLLGAISRFALL